MMNYEPHDSTGYDFLVLMFRMENEKEFLDSIELIGQHGIRAEEWIREFIASSKSDLPEKMRDLLDRFFSGTSSFGLSLAGEIYREKIGTAGEFVDYIERSSPADLLTVFVQGLQDHDCQTFDVSALMEKCEAVDGVIPEELDLPAEQREILMDMVKRPDKMKEELLILFKWVLVNIYTDIEEKIMILLSESKRKLVNLLRDNPGAIRILTDSEHPGNPGIGISVFCEIARLEFTIPRKEESLYLAGYRYPDIAISKDNPLAGSLQEIFRLLADDTNFKIAVSLAVSPKTFLDLVESTKLPLETLLERLDLLMKKSIMSFDRGKALYSLNSRDLASLLTTEL